MRCDFKCPICTTDDSVRTKKNRSVPHFQRHGSPCGMDGRLVHLCATGGFRAGIAVPRLREIDIIAFMDCTIEAQTHIMDTDESSSDDLEA